LAALIEVMSHHSLSITGCERSCHSPPHDMPSPAHRVGKGADIDVSGGAVVGGLIVHGANFGVRSKVRQAASTGFSRV
jgi:hypothetical protein